MVFASLDKEKASFDEYFGSMSWPYALPYTGTLAKTLSAKFKVQGIPTLVILDAKTGALVTTEGSTGISEDGDGSGFPYRVKGAWELLESVKEVIDADDSATPIAALKSLDAVGLYFSAHWCGPCRSFTPKLAEWYTAQTGPGGKLRGKVDIVFVSNDRDTATFDEYRKTMPWKSFVLSGNEAVKRSLSSLCKVEGIPSLVFIDKTGAILTRSGREKILTEPEGFPWPAPACVGIDESVESINEVATAVLFTDKVTSEDTEVAAIAAFTGVADECFAANGGKPLDNLRFAIARESDEAVGPVRKFLGPSFLSAKDGPTATTLVIIDVTNGKKYVFDGGVPTAETCRAFVQKFLADTLEGVNVRE